MKSVSKFFIYLSLASPLIIAPQTYFPFITGKALFFRATVELALLCYLAHLLFLEKNARRAEFERIREVFRHPAAIAVTIFTAGFLIASLTAVNPHMAFWSNFERGEGALQLIHYFTLFALGAVFFATEKDWKKIALYVSGINALVALYAIGQWLRYEGGLPNLKFIIGVANRASGTLGNSDYLGTYLLLNLFFAWFAFTHLKSRGLKILTGLIMAVMAGAIFTAQGRGAIIALGGGIIALLIYIILRKDGSKLAAAALFAIAIFTLAFIATSDAGIWKIVPALNRLRPENIFDTSLQTRLWTWGSSFAAIMEKPVLGWGPENFPLAFDKYYNARHFGIESWFDRAHNVFLDYAVSGGLVLLASYIAIFFLIFRKARRTNNKWCRLAALWFLMYLIQGMALFDILPTYLTLFLLFAFFVNADMDFSAADATKTYRVSPLNVFFVCVLLLCAVLYFFYTLYLPYQKNKLILRAIQNTQNNPPGIFGYFDKTLNFYSPIGQPEAAESFLFASDNLLQLLLNQNIKLPDETAKAVASGIDGVFEKNRDIFVSSRPLSLMGRTDLKLAGLTGNKSYAEKARNYCAEGNAVAPTRIEFLNCLYGIANQNNDTKEKKRLLDIIKCLRPDVAEVLETKM